MSNDERWISREEADALKPGSVIMLGGYLALQKDAEPDGSDPAWLAAGDPTPAPLDDLKDEAFPSLLVFEADDTWMEKVLALQAARRAGGAR